MSDAGREFVPAQIALLRAMGKARLTRSRVRRLPGLPFFAPGRVRPAEGGARGAGGELLWGARQNFAVFGTPTDTQAGRSERFPVPRSLPASALAAAANPGGADAGARPATQSSDTPVDGGAARQPALSDGAAAPQAMDGPMTRPPSPGAPPGALWPDRITPATGRAALAEVAPALVFVRGRHGAAVVEWPSRAGGGAQPRTAASAAVGAAGLPGLPWRIEAARHGAALTQVPRSDEARSEDRLPGEPRNAAAARAGALAGTPMDQPQSISGNRLTSAGERGLLPEPMPRRRGAEALPGPITPHRASGEVASAAPVAVAPRFPAQIPHAFRPEPLADPVLPMRAAHVPFAVGATVSSVVSMTDDLRRYVEQELDGVRQVVSRVSSQPAQASTPTPAAITNEAARQMLAAVRNLVKEERFRSGQLR